MMPQVIVIGSALVEITPDRPGQSVAEAERLVPLPSGSAANFAISLAHLGVSVGFITRVGDDELGEWLLRRLAEEGIERELMQKVPGQHTPCSFCWADLAGNKSFYFYRFPGFSDPMGTFSIADIEPSVIAKARIFDFTEATIRAEPLRSVALAIAQQAREAGVQVCYAVNYRPESWKASEDEIVAVQRQAIAAADIVLMNEEEAQLLLAASNLAEAASAIQALGPEIAAITCGERGALVAAQEQSWIEARKVEVCYDVGAGDAFHAGLLASLLKGMSPAEAGRFASDAAALKIGRPAEAPPPSWEDVVTAWPAR